MMDNSPLSAALHTVGKPVPLLLSISPIFLESQGSEGTRSAPGYTPEWSWAKSSVPSSAGKVLFPTSGGEGREGEERERKLEGYVHPNFYYSSCRISAGLRGVSQGSGPTEQLHVRSHGQGDTVKTLPNTRGCKFPPTREKWPMLLKNMTQAKANCWRPDRRVSITARYYRIRFSLPLFSPDYQKVTWNTMYRKGQGFRHSLGKFYWTKRMCWGGARCRTSSRDRSELLDPQNKTEPLPPEAHNWVGEGAHVNRYLQYSVNPDKMLPRFQIWQAVPGVLWTIPF